MVREILNQDCMWEKEQNRCGEHRVVDLRNLGKDISQPPARLSDDRIVQQLFEMSFVSVLEFRLIPRSAPVQG